MATVPDIALPVPTALSRPFWDAAREGRLALQRCLGCGTFRWTPQVLCPRCLAEEAEWTTCSGRGSIYSFTVVHHSPLPGFDPPYIVATVALEEGPLMLTRIIDCVSGAVRIGAPVDVALTPASDEITLYPFRLRHGTERVGGTGAV